ncbi:MAG: M56 family metallopeptidase, partial [Gemmatimonadota bacterium]
MIEWIVYCLTISALLGIAALAAERALGHYRRPVRWAWAGAIGGSALLPLAAWLVPQLVRGVSETLPMRTVSLDALAALGAGSGAGDAGPLSWLPSADALLAGVWIASVLGFGAYVAVAYGRLRREMRTWIAGDVLGSVVLLSPDRGPAVVGVARGVIVFPRWITELADELLRLVFLHEREHREAGDHRLFAGALIAVLAMPWNPVLWWQLRRLRLAIEYDCDRRVIARGVAPRAYGDALLAVGSRIGRLPLAAGFAEHRPAVER